jgi:hypothetical protein
MLVGTGIGQAFKNINKLHMMNYKKATMSDDKEKWKIAIDDKHKRMLKHSVKKEMVIEQKIMTST